ncbi:hypothetical protein AaE_007840 [Aphanomyces astaci]|uniref:EXS domain-containing protein n=1 Tax=Aphanomyces astaci TaxID=112090 RepID=A0A6A5AGF7_APHAT|nr:hypothetical protein AaE_007840 [Aphanomyces astaci]
MPSDVSYFFGGPLAINMFIAGGALNLMIFRSMGFPLEKVFGIHADEVPTPRGLITFAAFLTTLLGALYYVFKLHSIALIGRCHELVLVVYCVVVLALLTLPCNVLHVKFRRFLGRTLRRCLFPFTWVSSGGIVFAQTETPFVEVYIADGLTSMSKIFGDVAVAILMMRQSVVGVRDDMYTSKMKHHLLPYLATASPYMYVHTWFYIPDTASRCRHNVPDMTALPYIPCFTCRIRHENAAKPDMTVSPDPRGAVPDFVPPRGARERQVSACAQHVQVRHGAVCDLGGGVASVVISFFHVGPAPSRYGDAVPLVCVL